MAHEPQKAQSALISSPAALSPEINEKKTLSKASQISIFQLASFGIVLLAIVSLFVGEYQSTTKLMEANFAQYFSHFYSFTMNFYVVVCLLLVLSPFGKLRLAPNQGERPEFSTMSWWAMLFSAGMGIGLFFYGVVEPLSHHYYTFQRQTHPEQSLSLTMFHWGVHPWSCYAIVGLCFAYFSFRKQLPFSIRSCLLPVISKNRESIFRKIIETAAIICPVVGVATSLGLGAMQIAKGLDFSFGIDSGLFTQIAIIFTITVLSTASVVSGVEKGMKILSILNMLLAAILLMCIFYFASPLTAIADIGFDLITYFSSLIPIAWWSSHHSYIDDGGPINWTTFHWSAWIAWAPFVGMFIARISRGRTIREFLLGVILVPSLLSILWFSLLGRTSMKVLANSGEQVQTLLEQDLSTIFFLYLSKFSGSSILYALAIICLNLFFITSSDSAALVIATSAAEGNDPNGPSKIYWSVTISVLAIILLVGGGLAPMQIITIVSALPFAMVSLFMIACFFWDIFNSKLK